jgi:hypothetical protein
MVMQMSDREMILPPFNTEPFPAFSLLYSQEAFTGPYPEPDQSSPYHPILSL